jgi:hypothetical protein
MNSTVINTTGWTAGVRIPAGARVFNLFRVSRPALGPTLPPIQWVPEAFLPGVKRPVREADHLHLVPRSRMVESFLHTPLWRGA